MIQGRAGDVVDLVEEAAAQNVYDRRVRLEEEAMKCLEDADGGC